MKLRLRENRRWVWWSIERQCGKVVRMEPMPPVSGLVFFTCEMSVTTEDLPHGAAVRIRSGYLLSFENSS